MGMRVILCVTTLFTVAVLHVFSTMFFLYSKYLWLDIPMHFFGGMTCAFAFSSLPFFRIQLPSQYLSLSGYIGFVLLVGVFWEWFEIANGISIITDTDFFTDTLQDLCMDVLGTCAGYLVVRGSHNVAV